MPDGAPQEPHLSLALASQIDSLIQDWQEALALQVDSGEISAAACQACRRGWSKFYARLEMQPGAWG